jgi:hypothetical protein
VIDRYAELEMKIGKIGASLEWIPTGN